MTGVGEDQQRASNGDAVARGTTRASERITNAELLDALGVAVYMTDAAGLITDFNEAAANLWGRRPEIGKEEWCGSWRLYRPDGTPLRHDECPMAIALKENRPVWGEEAIIEAPTGTRIRAIVYPTPLRDASGTLIGAINVIVDITAHNAAETALRENELRLTEALAVKDEFLGLISHELRTPLTTILGNAIVLARDNAAIAEADRRAALGDIARESERLHAIIEDLLVLARVESRDALDGDSMDYEPVSLDRVIANCLEEFRRMYPARRIELSGVDPAPPVYGRATYVRQVMANLLSNAVKYSPLDSVIEVRVIAIDSTGCVHVLDRGRGIQAEDRETIFEPFRSTATARRTSGVGIGLAVCKRLVESMGGDMSVADRDGGGTDIGFSLPAVEVPLE